jgi:hypothetical protein
MISLQEMIQVFFVLVSLILLCFILLMVQKFVQRNKKD